LYTCSQKDKEERRGKTKVRGWEEENKEKINMFKLWMICDMYMTHFFHYEAHLPPLI
jgi:hypothetical protein